MSKAYEGKDPMNFSFIIALVQVFSHSFCLRFILSLFLSYFSWLYSRFSFAYPMDDISKWGAMTAHTRHTLRHQWVEVNKSNENTCNLHYDFAQWKNKYATFCSVSLIDRSFFVNTILLFKIRFLISLDKRFWLHPYVPLTIIYITIASCLCDSNESVALRTIVMCLFQWIHKVWAARTEAATNLLTVNIWIKEKNGKNKNVVIFTIKITENTNMGSHTKK